MKKIAAGVFALAFLLLAEAHCQPIKIGVILPLSGVRADAGNYMRNGLKLALEDLSDDVREKLELLFEDSQYDPKRAVSAYLKLSTLDGTRFIIGPYGTTEVLAVAPLSEKNQVVLLIPGAQADEISNAGQLIFRLIHNTAYEAPFFADFVARHMRGETLHLLIGQTAFSPAYLRHFKPRITANHKKIGREEEFEFNNTDFRSQLMRLKAESPTDIFVVATPVNSGHILKQAHELGIKAQWYGIGVESPEVVRIAGEFADGLLYPYSYDGHLAEKRVQEFYRRYVERHGEDPDSVAANSYDALVLLAKCFEKVGTRSIDVANCLYATKDFSGASGTFSIDSHGDAYKPLFIKTISRGKFVKFMD